MNRREKREAQHLRAHSGQIEARCKTLIQQSLRGDDVVVEARELARECLDMLAAATTVDPAAAAVFSSRLADLISDTLASPAFDGPAVEELGDELGEFAASLDLERGRLASYAEPQIRALARNTQLAALGGAAVDLGEDARTLDGLRKLAKVLRLDDEIVNQNLPALIVAIIDLPARDRARLERMVRPCPHPAGTADNDHRSARARRGGQGARFDPEDREGFAQGRLGARGR